MEKKEEEEDKYVSREVGGVRMEGGQGKCVLG